MTTAIGPSISRPGSLLPIASGRSPKAASSAVITIDSLGQQGLDREVHAREGRHPPAISPDCRNRVRGAPVKLDGTGRRPAPAAKERAAR